MSKSFQNEIPSARINIKLDLHTGGAQKKVELPLKLLVAGDYSNGQDNRPLAEREKVNIDKNNFDSVLSDFNPKIDMAVKNTLSPEGGDLNVQLNFKSMNDFHPEQIARNVPELRALMAMRNLLRDLKSNLLDDVSFRRELEAILKDENLSNELRAELEKVAPLNK
ncbi:MULTISPECIES: type VI secretion system contractile sheath small subunit [unclassified Neisseria]|uniref:type VI secretion system contractile sheath small subunit n=1 Tax=unclassified Neisseria TaxID=2623750 RepID=UPI0026671185|nr:MULTISPECIES: type VI secretion system contractile sheath small subunit [unclassified Neisseria]MDO1509041.1 type VI secretion system contractile sheath small subunit [Neisseria sp. MVDL19-042950]MDO1515300.1 type VI secretion system contractile sheath small subunit [Neisseria sp. MVDL18-041461]MDO1562660.1 type VI secretion system contractile sheath small subunit [Neisseria sp. MVDL20-010259]